MSSEQNSIETKFNNLKKLVSNKEYKDISVHGGNAIIVTYDPPDEDEYLNRVRDEYKEHRIIDLSAIFVSYVDIYGIDNMKSALKNYRSTPRKLFYNDSTSQKSFYDLIIDEIKAAIEEDKLPILIRTGILYGTHIENVKLLEHRVVSTSDKPLVIFYPSTRRKNSQDDEKIFFLNVKQANDYRGKII